MVYSITHDVTLLSMTSSPSANAIYGETRSLRQLAPPTYDEALKSTLLYADDNSPAWKFDWSGSPKKKDYYTHLHWLMQCSIISEICTLYVVSGIRNPEHDVAAQPLHGDGSYLVSDFITPVSPSKTRIQRKRTRRCTDCTHARFVTYITCDDYKKRWVNWVRLAENACVYRR